jgi:lysozyme family protein
MKENYPQALKQVLKYEGGYVDHPKDPGGPTNKGVTQAVYDNWRKSQNLSIQSVRAIADSEVAAIYKNLYWDRVSGDLLPSGVDFAVFDFAVNSGVSRAAKMLQSVVGVTQDGQIGPATILATKTYVAMSITNRRLAFMQSLSIWSTFGKGWSARIADVKAQIIALVK